ncbi:MAG: thioredoxin family protein [Bacteroidota bacterium]|nr:thioredoxin family protein [Bacteroidota bacterium]
MILILLICFGQLFERNPSNPVELGDVHWLRSYEEAQSKSKAECKPVLILFQEIPGCITCRTYGSEVLTNPLIVEAIETHFIPLAIYNNKGGADEEVLKRFNEPAWNNPVVRVVDEKGNDVLPRLNGNYSAAGLAETMVSALIKSRGKAPAYLQLLADELSAEKRGLQSVTYAMYCFWTGEAHFGKLNGVVKTTAGFQDGKEVVKVEYDPTIITKAQLDKSSTQLQCKTPASGSFRNDATPKYYLAHHAYKNIPMTEIQKCRVNSAIGEGQDPDVFLSPKQLQRVRE